jgi:uncharacterized protein YciI
MQYLLVAFDGKDPDALTRRLNVRTEHLEKVSILKKNEEFLFGGAILDDEGKMIGSMIVYDVPDRETLDERLKNEPYITAGVWKDVRIMPFRLANIE